MLRREGGHGHVRVLVDDAAADLVRVHGVSLRKRTYGVQLAVLRPRLEVGAIRLEQVLGHSRDADGTVDLERHAPADDPRREDQIRISDV